jgi:uncharacterized membrane protein YjjP (DUF1212 family)
MKEEPPPEVAVEDDGGVNMDSTGIQEQQADDKKNIADDTTGSNDAVSNIHTVDNDDTTSDNDGDDDVGDMGGIDMDYLLSTPAEFQTALRLGIVALRFGAVSYKVENFLVRLLKRFGYSSTVWVVNTDLFLSIYHYHPEVAGSIDVEREAGGQEESRWPLMMQPSMVRLPYTVSVPIKEGADLQKLEDLSCICADLLHGDIDLSQAAHLLEELENQGPHWNVYFRSVAYAVTSAGFAAILKGSWTDVWLSLLGGILSYVATSAFSRYWPTTRNTLGMLMAALLPAILATTTSLIHDLNVNTSIVSISSIIAEVPGFSITKGTSELGKNLILAGLGHWIKAILAGVWLACGVTLGSYGTLLATGKDIEDTRNNTAAPIPELWYLLVAPVLGLCFSIYFSVGRRQLFMSVVVCCIGFGMSLTIEYFGDPNLGNVVAAFVTTLAGMVWSRSWHHKCLYGMDHVIVPSPASVVVLPSFFILVGGSIGVQAFSFIVVGNTVDGSITLLQYLLLPATLVLGMYLAQVIVPSTSVL